MSENIPLFVILLRRFGVFPLLFIILIAVPRLCPAQAVDGSLYQSMRWRMIGP